MATITDPSTSLPVANDDMDSEQITDWIGAIKTFLHGNNLDENNVDYSSSDGVMVLAQAQVATGLHSFEATTAAAGGVREVVQFGIDPATGTPAANDGGRFVLYADDAGGAETDIAYIDWVMTDATVDACIGRIDFYVAPGADTLVSQVQLGDGFLQPTTDSDVSLGVTGQRWSNLYVDAATVGGALTLSGAVQLDSTLTIGVDGTGYDVVFHSATSGDNLTWDASEEVLQITGTDGQTALDVLDGDVKVVDKLYFYDRGGEYLSSDGSILTITGAVSTSSTLATTGAATLASLVCTAGGTFGGGYGDTGATISTAGVIQANGAITSDGAVTGATLAGTISTATQNSITTATSLASVGTITSGTWSGVIDGSCTMTLGSDATGDIYYRDASGFLERLASGADGDVLTGTGVGSIPAWEAIPGGATLTGSTNNTITTVTGANAFQGEANLTFDGTTLDVVGNAGVGIARTDGTLHVHTATAGSVAAGANADDLVVESSGNTGISILAPDANTSKIHFGSPSDDDFALISGVYDSGTSYLQQELADGTFVRFVESMGMGVNETLNANMTIGLTLNQGANDNQIFALKSSDVAHSITNGGYHASETDDFFFIKKRSATVGGAVLVALAEDAASTTVMGFQASGGTADTAKSSSSAGLFNFHAAEQSGGNVQGVTANGNVFAIAARIAGPSERALFVVDEDGDYHYDGADGGAFDFWEDAPLLRTLTVETADPATIVRSRFDELIKYNKQDLIDAKLLGYCSPEDEANGHDGLINGAQMQRALVGQAWQGYCRDVELKEELDELRQENIKLASRLNLLEN